MRFPWLVLAVVVAAVGLSGCQDELVVKVNADGSGTVERTRFFTNEELKSMQEGAVAIIPDGLKRPNIDPKPLEVYDPFQLDDDAKTMGEGVKLISAKRIENEKGKGYKAVYSFEDVNQLRLDQEPPEGESGKSGAMLRQNNKKPVRFHFAKGKPSELILSIDHPKAGPEQKEEEKKDEQPQISEEAVTAMLKDTRMTFVVEVAGKIVETNASFHENSRVFIEETDFSKLLAIPKEKANAIKDWSPEGLRKAGISGEGMRNEPASEVKIKFQ